jgi:site-specific DNA-methyltransferase (adenine-specific)
MEDTELWMGDCLELMGKIEDQSVDMILADLPYGTTACAWDIVIPFEPLWYQYKRIIKSIGCIALFGSEPFSSFMRLSNLEMYKYDWIWKKSVGNGFVHAKNKPLKRHEIISIFSKGTTVHASQSKTRMVYNPQMTEGKPYYKKMTNSHSKQLHAPSKGNLEFANGTECINNGVRYPITVIEYPNGNNKNSHQTQKPVPLLEYLIKTYTNEGMSVLDNVMGSGSTGVAAKNLGRKFIGIEKDPRYFKIAQERIFNQ